MTRLTVVFAGRVAICAAVIVFSATGVPWTPVDVAFAVPMTRAASSDTSTTVLVETSTAASAGPSDVSACSVT